MKDLMKNLKFAYKYTEGTRKYILIYILSNLIYITCSIISPILSAKIIVSLTNSNFVQIIVVGVTIMIVRLFSILDEYLSRVCMMKLYRGTLSLLEVDLSKNILKLNNECLEKNGSGLFIQRLTNDTSRIADAINNLVSKISVIVKYLGILVAIFVVNKLVFAYVSIFLVALFIIERGRTITRNENDKIYRKASERVSGFIGELVRGARDIKMLNSEPDFINELDKRIYDANNKRMSMQRSNWNYKLVIWNLEAFFEFSLIALLVLLMMNYNLPSTNALVIFNYTSGIMWSVYVIGDLMENMKDFNLSSDRVIEIINGKKFTKEKFGKKHLDKVNGDFEFKNVTFSYGDKKVLDKINFKINANETVAFVGKSGAGKTTIFNLLCKMYNVDSGEITIDGMNIKELDKESIRGNITIISQNPYIFNMTIRENLKLVKNDLTEEEMIEACKVACLDSFIKELPDGYDTVIGEGGVNLSGGQKQRLAIARALVQKTEIILFDEATSALDNETQNEIQKAINNMKGEYTMLIIAHRLSTVIDADRILLINDGKVEAEGSHAELLKNNEVYKSLYQKELI